MLTALVVKKEGISCKYKLKYKLITLRTSCYLTNFKMFFFFAGVMNLPTDGLILAFLTPFCAIPKSLVCHFVGLEISLVTFYSVS